MKNEIKTELPGIKPVLFLAALLVALIACGSFMIYRNGTLAFREQAKAQSVWIYTEGIGSPDHSAAAPHKPNPGGPAKPPTQAAIPELLKQMEEWTTKVSLATAAGGGALMLAVVFSFIWWRQAWVSRFSRDVRDWKAEAETLGKAAEGLKCEAAERQKLEKELAKVKAETDQRVEQRTADLEKKYKVLESELNERKSTEKALAQQTQELERSKDVLEMHVQARTQELQKLRHRYEYILNSAGEGIYGLDLQGKTTFVNPAAARITGWNVEELVGKPEREIFHRDSVNAAVLSHDAAKEPSGHQPDQTFFRKDGTSFPAEYVRTPILENNRPVGSVVIFKDITERKRTEETLARKAAELARSNAELEQFAYVASHDLQEPLRKIQAFGDRLKTKCEAVQLDEGRDYLERMQSAAARMQTLINDLLKFSRVISTSQAFVPVDLAIVTQEVLTDLEVRIEQTKTRVEVGPLPTIEADPLQMRQLLQNLIGNAIKFQLPDAQPIVKINALIIKSSFSSGAEDEQDGDWCEIVVQDNGIGFEEKYSEKIFVVFQRLHPRSDFEGTGVGLAVCRRIADRHGGTIVAKSTPGEGAAFTVTLPVRHCAQKELAA